jgi:hypothetical protein
MMRNKGLDWLGIGSLAGMLVSYCWALCAELAGNEELKEFLQAFMGVCLLGAAVTLAIYGWEIARKRRAYRRNGR